MAKKIVLVVEDDQILNRIFGRYISEAEGLEAVAAFSLQEALPHVATAACVLADMKLPDSEGLATFLAIKQACRDAKINIPIIAITGFADDEEALRIIAAGAFDFMAKPVTGHYLLAKIMAAIEQAESKQRLYELIACQTGLAASHRRMDEIEAHLANLSRELIGDRRARLPGPDGSNQLGNARADYSPRGEADAHQRVNFAAYCRSARQWWARHYRGAAGAAGRCGVGRRQAVDRA